MTISRRKLVGAAGLLPPFAAAFTLSSAVKASEPETSDAESCSVAVIGAGAAGLAAAIAAKEAGAVRVVVLEKTALAGGHMMVSSGMLNAVDPEGQKRFGRTDSAEHFFATPMRAAAVWATRTSSRRWFVRVLTSLLGSRAWGLNLIRRFMKPTPASILARIEQSKHEAAWHTAEL